MSDLAWPIDGPSPLDLASIKRYSTCIDSGQTRTPPPYSKRLYPNTSCMAKALAKFRGKCEFLKWAYRLTDTTRKTRKLSTCPLKVNAKTGKAIKIVKTTAQANIQNVNADIGSHNKTVRVCSDL